MFKSSYITRVVSFMKWKQQHLAKLIESYWMSDLEEVKLIRQTKSKTPSYFNYNDESLLYDLSQKSIQLIKDAYRKVKNSNQLVMSDVSTCPFCILTDNTCFQCAYGENHGICALDKDEPVVIKDQDDKLHLGLDEISDYQIIKLAIHYFKKNQVNTRSLNYVIGLDEVYEHINNNL